MGRVRVGVRGDGLRGVVHALGSGLQGRSSCRDPPSPSLPVPCASSVVQAPVGLCFRYSTLCYNVVACKCMPAHDMVACTPSCKVARQLVKLETYASSVCVHAIGAQLAMTCLPQKQQDMCMS